MFDVMSELWAQLPEIEDKVRGMLWWGVGDSQLLLWSSALLQFTIVVTVFATLVGWVAGKITTFFIPKR